MKKHKLIGIGLASIGVITTIAADVGSVARMVGVITVVVGVAWFIVGRAHD
jgi:hypothetical protein